MRNIILVGIWLLTDLFLFIGVYVLAYFLRVGWIFSSDFPFDTFLNAAVAAAIMWLAVLATTRTFTLTRNQASLRNGAYIAYSCLVGMALFTLAYYFAYTSFFSRLLLVYALTMSIVTVWLWHIVFDQIRRRILRIDPPEYRALIVGVTRESKVLIQTLNEKMNPITPVAILDGRGAKESEIDGVLVKGKLNKLEEVLRHERITHMIQCSDLEQSLNLLSACRQHGITYMLLPSVLGIIERDERIESLEGFSMTVVNPK